MLNKAIAVVVGLILVALVVSAVRQRNFHRQQDALAAEKLRCENEQALRDYHQREAEKEAEREKNIAILTKHAASLRALKEQYRNAMENGDVAEVRRIGAVVQKLRDGTEEGRVEARKKAANARYDAKRKQLFADYRAAIDRGDTESAARIADDIAVLAQMSDALEKLDFRAPTPSAK